ncbi:hypothetical protein [Natribacillus halophilus]|uniref:Uncharacterized protein n=1 Tax=Natribacillus halophilus TaxID=549003 RepID=A0A1G8J6J8_9BACI|nr:hypothetical protein [Natribacillus halophilus]SDI26874.1 hypothetical protein SAMN04488123_10159 [Natribacillus halophilus]
MHKEQVKDIIDNMPENSSFEDLQYTIFVQSKIQGGLQAVENGDIVSQDEVEKRIEKWLKE